MDVAEQIVGFLQQFLEIFNELKGVKFYLAGESVSPPLFQLQNQFDNKAVCRDVRSM
jgi:hypothetical protein